MKIPFLPAPSETNWNLSVEPIFGTRWGFIGEYVYLKNCNYANNILSLLEWETKPQLYYGGRISGGWRGIKLSAQFTSTIPCRAGTVKDSDWYNTRINNTYAFQYKTHYTESDCQIVNDSWDFEIRGGYTFSFWDFFELTPFASFSKFHRVFDGNGLCGWYAKSNGAYYYPWYDADLSHKTITYKDPDTTVLAYERYTYLVSFGATLQANLPFGLSVAFGVETMPYHYMESLDKHTLTGAYYLDKVKGYYDMFRFSTMIAYHFTENLSLVLNGSVLFSSPNQGDSFSSYNEGKTYKQSSDAYSGANENYIDICLSLRYTFL
ncbi:MAG: hypothetical protein IJS09_10660 [Treponema sp.]|nr:hypothetical protein [Treponema sp.]